VLVDQLLSHRRRPEGTAGYDPRPAALAGRVANANAKLAYQSFKTIFSGPRWQALADQGAHVQRPLWASTSTKNPDYSDVMYVNPLIGPDTVNTMPEETSSAFADHGKLVENAVDADLEEARQVLKELEAVGIDLDKVTWQLQHEGVQKFIEPFNTLLQALAQKC
jgi:transaldolase